MEEKLIEAVRLRELLYDTSHEDYMRTKLKTEKWSEIAKELGMKTGTEAKALWEKLRHSLRDAIRRQQKCYKSGAPPDSIKEWRFQKQMGFLQPYMANKSKKGNLPEEDDEIMTQDSTEMDHETVKTQEEEEEVNIQDERVGEHEIQILSDNPASLTSTLKTTPRSSKKIKKDVAALYRQSMEKREERAKSRIGKRKTLLKDLQPTQNDPLFHFFLSMYQSTKKMPPFYQHMVRNLVFNAVSDVEAKILNIHPMYDVAQESTQQHHSSVQQQASSIQQQPYYHMLQPGPSTSLSCSSSSTPGSSTPPNGYSENSRLSPTDNNIEEQDN